MSASRVLCLLAALLAVTDAQGTARSCYQCRSRTANSCLEQPKTCPIAQSSCLSVWEENTLVKAVAHEGTFYSCIPSSIPSRNISLFFGNGLHVKIQSQVCSTDGCNTRISPVLLPIINDLYNGGWCPICFAPGQSSCSSNGTLRCEGRASRCISINGAISEEDITIPFAAQGCATPDACSLETGMTLDSGVFTYKITQATCYPPRSAAQTLGPFILGSVMSGLAGLLVLKFLS